MEIEFHRSLEEDYLGNKTLRHLSKLGIETVTVNEMWAYMFIYSFSNCKTVG